MLLKGKDGFILPRRDREFGSGWKTWVGLFFSGDCSPLLGSDYTGSGSDTVRSAMPLAGVSLDCNARADTRSPHYDRSANPIWE